MRVQATAVHSVRLTGVFELDKTVVDDGFTDDVSICNSDIGSDRVTPRLLPPRTMICGRALGRTKEEEEEDLCMDLVAVRPVEE